MEAPALALTLERIGVRDNAVATRLHGLLQRPDVREDAQAMRLLQASLALIERPVLAGSFDASVAGGLLAALVDRVEAEGAARGVSAWVSGSLAAACRPLAPSETLDGQLATALSGPAPAVPSGSNGKGSATSSIARRPPGPGSSACARRRVGRRSTSGPATATALADALVALIYASALPATDPELLASRPEARHDFGPMHGAGAQDHRAWRLAEPASAAGRPGTCPAACSAWTSRWRSPRCAGSATIRRRRRCPPRIASRSRGRWRC